MEVLSFQTTASGESSCDDSTGPTTPNSSPLFCPSIAEDLIETPFSFLSGSTKPRIFHAIEPQVEKVLETRSYSSVRSEDVANICFIGAGYVGGPTAAVLALHNPLIKVNVLDKDERRVRRWNSSHPPIDEPGLHPLIRLTRDGALPNPNAGEMDTMPNIITPEMEDSRRLPNIFFTSDSQKSVSEADIIFLAVSTPTKTFGVGAGRATDMSAVDGAVKEIAAYARPGTIIVEKSTVPCGTAKRIRQTLHELRPGVPFEILSNPEFLSEGSAVENLMKPDRILIGSLNTLSGRRSANVLARLYTSWIPSSRILQTNVWSSELSKLVANAMLAQRISSINSVSAICDATGANIDEVAKSVGLDPRVGSQFLKSGLGFGGSCFRKDISSLTYLAKSMGLDEVADYWDQVNLINSFQRSRFAKNVIHRLDESLVGKKITLLGFAFKKNTGDPRESLAVDVVRTLLEERPAEIAVFDPHCREEDIQRELKASMTSPLDANGLPQFNKWSPVVKIYSDAYQACSQADAVLIITDHDEFRNKTLRRGNEANRTITPTIAPTISFKQQQSEELYISTIDQTYKLLCEPICEEECTFCNDLKSSPSSINTSTNQAPIQWSQISQIMKSPKWLFDGRGLLDVSEMTKLGFRIDTIGRGRFGE